ADRHHPRPASRATSGIASMASPGIGLPSPRDAASTSAASCQWVVACTMARARAAGSSDLNTPEPTNTASAPSAMQSAASAGRAGRAAPAGRKRRPGPPPGPRAPAHELVGPAELLGVRHAPLGCGGAHPLHLAADLAQVATRLHDVAAARLALAPDHRGSLADATESLAEPARAAHERHPEGVLVDVVLVVRRGEDLALVDEVDPELLEQPSLHHVSDAALRHHRDRHRRAH